METVWPVLRAAALFVCAYWPAKAVLEAGYWNADAAARDDGVNDAGVLTWRRALARRSWLLSAMVAALLSVEGLLYALPAVLRALLYPPQGSASAAIHGLALADWPRARVICDIFSGFCIADLVVGAVEYPSEISLVLGIVHHVGYLAFIGAMRAAGYPNAFWMWAWCEIPTLLLAAAKITGDRRYRVAFNVAFVALRVLLFAVALGAFYAHCTLAELAWTLPIGLPILAVHGTWADTIVRSPRGWPATMREVR